MSNYSELLKREQDGCPIRVAVVGAGGAMGLGIALQLGKTPGVRMVAAIDVDLAQANRAAQLHGRDWARAGSRHEISAALGAGRTVVTDDAFGVLADGCEAVDVLIE